MCTAATYQTKDFYFGRNLDLEYSYHETVTVTPRNFPLPFRCRESLQQHYAIIGMAYVADGYPLYYDATNEKGLSMAGLNFEGNTCYFSPLEGRDNITPFEFTPWILGQCADLQQARKLLEQVNLVNIPFNEELPLSQLHWMIADKSGCLVVESMVDGFHVYDNPLGVLTNNPPFEMQMLHLGDYMALSNQPAVNRMCPHVDLTAYSRGMGAMGLPGDLSSASRFVRSAFVRNNSASGQTEGESISQFFHILGSVEQQRGCVQMEDGRYEITVYSSCCNTDRGIYYYTAYENSQITGVDMHREDLDSDQLVSYPLLEQQQIRMEN